MQKQVLLVGHFVLRAMGDDNMLDLLIAALLAAYTLWCIALCIAVLYVFDELGNDDNGDTTEGEQDMMVFEIVMLVAVTAICYMALVVALYEASGYFTRKSIGSRNEPKDEPNS